ncbi:acyl-CoA thioesterase-1 [Arenibacter palladensis]|uniref:Acyl-CoA thioesterase-1 n=1 Tax=Arenibacter palladensis TaxID=237373 RepID=A0A1M4XNJ8_9FLAO|nr:arylesterase [Arenibacter palladensis]SHE95177.1 acyl-CoA thioesterase-1 [Arenibacter palladensis]
MRTLLRFSYLLFIFFTSCGNMATKKADAGEKVEEAIENKVETKSESKVILFFGNSLTAGMGLDPNEAFPALIQEKIDSLQLPYKVVNAGLSGETTASGKNRLGWVLNADIEVFVLELGANDGLRGISLEETRGNLQEIIDVVQQKNPNTTIILAGMQIPPNMGQDYTSEFKDIFPDLAKKNNVGLIPFLLEDVAGNPELNQPDGIHPTAEGQKIIANNIWPIIAEIINE